MWKESGIRKSEMIMMREESFSVRKGDMIIMKGNRMNLRKSGIFISNLQHFPAPWELHAKKLIKFSSPHHALFSQVNCYIHAHLFPFRPLPPPADSDMLTIYGPNLRPFLQQMSVTSQMYEKTMQHTRKLHSRQIFMRWWMTIRWTPSIGTLTFPL